MNEPGILQRFSAFINFCGTSNAGVVSKKSIRDEKGAIFHSFKKAIISQKPKSYVETRSVGFRDLHCSARNVVKCQESSIVIRKNAMELRHVHG